MFPRMKKSYNLSYSKILKTTCHAYPPRSRRIFPKSHKTYARSDFAAVSHQKLSYRPHHVLPVFFRVMFNVSAPLSVACGMIVFWSTPNGRGTSRLKLVSIGHRERQSPQDVRAHTHFLQRRDRQRGAATKRDVSQRERQSVSRMKPTEKFKKRICAIRCTRRRHTCRIR